MKIDFDKFYTPIEIAKKCINEIDDLNTYDSIIEPSAGNGSFSNLLDCLAFDIEPENDNIIKADFFKIKNVKGEHKLFIGNPPFGARSCLAKAFIKHSIELGAETIAFILPNTFNKLTLQKCFEDYKLKKIVSLDCEYKANGIDYFVPSSFFIITKKDCIDLRKIKPKELKSFRFLGREDKNADFVISGNNGKVRDLNEVTNPKTEHYIKVNDGYDINTVRQNLSNTKFEFYSSINGKLSYIGQNDIKEAYGRQFEI